jgi:3-deoxy-D-manno-octulosonate 8-phosphate phosphatase KdsC-like HAD superfamily phosphatase
MGDGIFDPLVFRSVKYSIAPRNASSQTQREASFVTESKGAEGAVAEASIHLMDTFFGGFKLPLH